MVDFDSSLQISKGGMDILTVIGILPLLSLLYIKIEESQSFVSILFLFAIVTGMVPPDGHRRVLETSNNFDKNPRFYWILRELWAAISIIPLSFVLVPHSLFL